MTATVVCAKYTIDFHPYLSRTHHGKPKFRITNFKSQFLTLRDLFQVTAIPLSFKITNIGNFIASHVASGVVLPDPSYAVTDW